MKTLKELKYSKSHEWVRCISDNECEVGLTDYAQESLGDLVFVNLPEVGDNCSKEETVCDVESVKAVSDVYSPVSGEIYEVNEALLDAPETINEDPYGAWLYRVKDVSGLDDLLTSDEYEEFVINEEH